MRFYGTWTFQICEEFGSIRTICQGKSNENLIVGTTHNCILTGDFLIGMETVLAHGHENDIRTLLSPFNGQFLSLSHDKWIRMWDVKKHCVVWNYYAGVSRKKYVTQPLLTNQFKGFKGD